MSEKKEKYSVPLAERMRPEKLDQMLGQEHILGPGKLLRQSIEKDTIPSFIMWGPPGCGKTTLARIIKKKTSGYVADLPAVTSGVKDVRKVIEQACIRKKSFKQKTILFVDEVHRFNKAQQDAFLPHVEKGLITLIGATTENPYFEVISPLLSRTRIYRMNPLSNQDMKKIILNALADEEKGIGDLDVQLDDEALDLLVNLSGGDARIALTALETAALAVDKKESGQRELTVEHVFDSLQKKRNLYDKAGDSHYDTISAFIKSVRGSDPDAALYYLAKMLYSGEDPRFVARRMVILASEDVGLADPFALNIANAAAQAVEFVGMPEAKITLAQAAVYLAGAPKSNSAYKGINAAWKTVEKGPSTTVPLSLRNPVTDGMKKMGYGKEYMYSHDYEEHFARQQFLPDEIKDHRFYHPGNLGHEKRIRARLKKWWGKRFED